MHYEGNVVQLLSPIPETMVLLLMTTNQDGHILLNHPTTFSAQKQLVGVLLTALFLLSPFTIFVIDICYTI
jgi:hypothetical protein